MAMIDRVKNILLAPRNEWPKIAAETASVQSLYGSWIAILAALGPLALLLSTLGLGIGVALAGYVIALAVVYVVALIADAIAPRFGGEKNFIAALKLVAYSMTPGWVAGLFQIVPALGGLIALAGSLYGIYLFFLGAPELRKCAAGKAAGYTAVVALVVLVLQFLIGGMVAAALFGGSSMSGLHM